MGSDSAGNGERPLAQSAVSISVWTGERIAEERALELEVLRRY